MSNITAREIEIEILKKKIYAAEWILSSFSKEENETKRKANLLLINYEYIEHVRIYLDYTKEELKNLISLLRAENIAIQTKNNLQIEKELRGGNGCFVLLFFIDNLKILI
jgi:hypothetical protein